MPLYFQLAEILKERIEAGRWLAGERFPSERELADEFRISRTVIRPALDLLESDGQLVRIKGRGTFVTPPKAAWPIAGLARLLARPRDGETEVRILSAGEQEPDPDVREVLELEANAGGVVQATAVLLSAGSPIYMSNSFVVRKRLPALAELLTAGRVDAAASWAQTRASARLTSASATIATAFVSQWEATQLDLAAGDLCFLIRYVERTSGYDGTHPSSSRGSCSARTSLHSASIWPGACNGSAVRALARLLRLMTTQPMSDNEYLFTSESVTEGHPDKMADQISDGVLDAVMAEDPEGRVACETLVNTGLVVVSGEITTDVYVDIPKIARETIRKIGYSGGRYGFDCDSCAVITAIDEQSPDIAQGVDKAYEARTDPADDDELDVAGAGDQGMMFGYATRETKELMPLPISLAHKLAHRLAEVRRAELVPYLGPDGKTQVTIRYENGRPIEIERVLISTQHKDGVDAETLIKPDLWEHVVHPVLPGELYDEKKLLDSSGHNFLVNPTGKFVIGGPVGDAGLTGRKIIVDTYGGMARHGGGAFSGKDPSKVDRSAAYAARYVAKNVVAAGLADKCEVQVAYAIGVAHPVSVMVETFGTERVARSQIAALVERALRPAPGRVPQVPRPPPSDLPQDGGLRPLRP